MDGVQLATLSVISFSRASHRSLFINQPISTHTPEETNKATWLAPSNVALPNTLMQHTSNKINTRKGMNASIFKCKSILF